MPGCSRNPGSSPGSPGSRTRTCCSARSLPGNSPRKNPPRPRRPRTRAAQRRGPTPRIGWRSKTRTKSRSSGAHTGPCQHRSKHRSARCSHSPKVRPAGATTGDPSPRSAGPRCWRFRRPRPGGSSRGARCPWGNGSPHRSARSSRTRHRPVAKPLPAWVCTSREASCIPVAGKLPCSPSEPFPAAPRRAAVAVATSSAAAAKAGAAIKLHATAAAATTPPNEHRCDMAVA
mmetsp:Transcript_175598/g.563154  ORF Transcript_175598/g.563154 Transcript_175598/m.563154 type:complete len:231 (+) Transcript_175598:317-1009(+)